MHRTPAFIVALLLCAGCTAAARPPASTCPVVPQLTLPDVQSQIDTYIDSGRYAADFAVVADSARAWLEEEAPKRSARRSSSTSTRPRSRIGRRTGSTAGRASSPAVATSSRARAASAPGRRWGARRRCRPRSHWCGAPASSASPCSSSPAGRPSCAKRRNAISASRATPGTASSSCRPGAHFQRAADFKAPERRRIAENGYTILLTIGDQQSDLDGGYAEKTFKLPNPVYTLP